jgi:predicted nucleic acid-binding protein
VRTTLTLDPDVAAKAKQAAAKLGKPFKEVVNSALRADSTNSWLRPRPSLTEPTNTHWRIFQDMMRSANASGHLVSDAHLAALAVEHNCTLWSTDTDFAKFKALKWRNPVGTG